MEEFKIELINNTEELANINGGGRIFDISAELGEKAGGLFWRYAPTIAIALIMKKI